MTSGVYQHKKGIKLSEEHKNHMRKKHKSISKLTKIKQSNFWSDYYKKHIGFRKGMINSEEHNQKIREKSLEQFKNGMPEETKIKLKNKRKFQILPVKDTSIEIRIQNFLKQLNIEFLTHQYMHIEHGYQCDIFIPSINLVIECDGTYWHKYPTRSDVDNIRTKELLEKGFKVLRLWEFEINQMSVEEFKKEIYKYGQ